MFANKKAFNHCYINSSTMIDFAAFQPNLKIKKQQNNNYIFDEVRKKWLLLTPEELVRQYMVHYLINQLQYPLSLLAVEKEIKVNNLKRRADIVVYKNALPWMIIECKADNVELTESVVTQALHYNIALQVNYIIITNGNNTFAWEIDNNNFILINKFPKFDD